MIKTDDIINSGYFTSFKAKNSYKKQYIIINQYMIVEQMKKYILLIVS